MPPRRLLTLLSLIFLAAFPLSARGEPRTLVITDELQMGLAEAFMAEGEYYRAVTEYKKFLYFFPDSDQAGYARLQIGMAYYKGGECPQAIEAFAKVRRSYPSEQFATAAFYEGVCRNRMKNPGAAMDDFARVVDVVPGTPEAANALAGQSLVTLDREDWTGSRQALEHLAAVYPDKPLGAAAKEAIPLVAAAETKPRKSPLTAGILSAVVPGSGYAYAGRPRDGMMAFLVNGLFIAGTAVAIEDENYPAAVLLGGIGLPFYLGNIYGSANAARQWNLSIARDLRKELELRLEFHY
jgi:tetratricopeptide (TPR) repeat protein